MSECTLSSCVNYCCKMCWPSCHLSTWLLTVRPADIQKEQDSTLLKAQQANREINCYRFDFKKIFLRDYLRAQTEPTSWLSTPTCQILRAKGWMVIPTVIPGWKKGGQEAQRRMCSPFSLSPASFGSHTFLLLFFSQQNSDVSCSVTMAPNSITYPPSSPTPSSMPLGRTPLDTCRFTSDVRDYKALNLHTEL